MHYHSDAKRQHSSGRSPEPDQAKPLPVKPPHSIGTTAASQATTDKTNRKTHNKETRNKQKGKTMQKTTLAAVATAAALILIVGIAITGQTRWIVPLGVVLLAAASAFLIALPRTTSETPRKRDERGITLQTLIVTAVLVLMAGAAGVVIIAITNNANDNLEGQNSGIDSRCEPWEIFDPTLDAAGRGGGEGGVGSSASGCVRVCYIRNKDSAEAIAGLEDDTTASPEDDIGGNLGKLELLISRADIATSNTAAELTDVKATLVVTGNDKLTVKNDDKEAAETIKLSVLDIASSNSAPAATNNKYDQNNMSIEVAPNQRYCRVWNNTDDEEVIRSKN